MRALYIAAAFIAVAAGAGGIRANITGTGPTSVPLKPVFGGPATSIDSYDRSKLRNPKSRLARQQPVIPQDPVAEATSTPNQAPFKWVGLLLIPNGTVEEPTSLVGCTAQFILPNVLLTAAHCLKDLEANPTGPWPDPTKGTFWLQHRHDQGIAFKIVCGATNPLWVLPSDYNAMTHTQQTAAFIAAMQHDFAMILVDGTSPTGVMPYALDWKGKFKFGWRIGYPQDVPDRNVVQSGFISFADAIPLGPWSLPNLIVQWGPVTHSIYGTSGGAWIANLSATESSNNNVLIAVTSRVARGPSRLGDTQALSGGTFAAYLTAAEFNPLLTFVSNGCK
jgi:hypothetical protein